MFDQTRGRSTASSQTCIRANLNQDTELDTPMRHRSVTASSRSANSRITHDWDILIAEAIDLEASLAKWQSQIPPTWVPLSVSSTECIHWSIGSSDMYGTTCDIYPSINVAGLWNWYRTLRISNIRVLMTCLNSQDSVYVHDAGTPSTQQITEVVQTLTDDFCKSVPFHLGNRQATSVGSDSKNICYPTLPLGSVTTPDQGVFANTVTSTEHKHIAALSGTWYLLDPLKEILAITAPYLHDDISSCLHANTSNGSQPLLRIRPGQREWLISQLERIESINAKDRLSRKPTNIIS